MKLMKLRKTARCCNRKEVVNGENGRNVCRYRCSKYVLVCIRINKWDIFEIRIEKFGSVH